MGKGSKRRPTLVDEDTFARRWEKAFGGEEPGTREGLDGPEPRSVNEQLAAEEDAKARSWEAGAQWVS